MSNEKKCLLAGNCRLAGGAACNNYCPSYIAMGGRIKYAGLPARYRLTTLADASPRKDQPSVYRQLDAYVKTFERQFDADAIAENPIKSFYLYSASPGTGKTTTAAALLNEWIRVSYLGAIKRGIQPSKQPAFFLDINEWQADYNLAAMTKDEDGMAGVKRTMLKAMNADFLVIDDLGVRSPSDAFKGYVHDIVNARCSSGNPTIYTSNLKRSEMANIYDKRVFDRIKDLSAELHFDGASHRGRK